MGQITCTSCGTINDSGHKFCVNCGASLPTASTGNAEAQGGCSTQSGYKQSQNGYQQTQSGYQQDQSGYQQNQGGYQQNQGGYQQNQSGYQQNQGGYQQNSNGYQQYQGYQPGMEQKSKMAAGLLGIFLGTLGVHNFYLGYTGKAIAQLLITVLSCGILFWVSSIWGVVEGILILSGSINTDGKGIPLKE